MIKKLRLFVFLLLLAADSTSYAQSDSSVLNHHIKALQQYTNNNPIEKVHLHLDRPWYGLGDTIWFKAYTVVGGDHRLTALSGVLYVELAGPADTILQRLTLHLNAGMAGGDFVISSTYPHGTYHLRAFTNWMRNDTSYIYDKQLTIGGIKLPPADNLNVVLNKSNDKIEKKNISNYDIQFFPEGGYMVEGLRSKVAVKCINKYGHAVDVQGLVIDGDNNEILPFSTQHAGMGQFALMPEAGKQYKAKITFTDSSNLVVDLPKALDKGFTLTLNNTTDSIYVKVAANKKLLISKLDTAFYLIGHSGGKCYFAAAGKLLNNVFVAQIAKNRFPTGIAQFTLFSQSGEPLNERAIFVQNKDALKLVVSSDKLSYAPIEQVKLNLKFINGHSNTTTGVFSLAVTNETQVPVDEAAETTILTDFLLTSELKGNIENPGYYFANGNINANSDLDLLMLTQGYTRFNWKQILDDKRSPINYQAETGYSLSGALKTSNGKAVPNGKIHLTAIKDLFSIDTTSDANGNFKFANLYLMDSTKVVIDAKKSNGNDNVQIMIHQNQHSTINQTANQILEQDYKQMSQAMITALKQTYVNEQQLLLKNVIQLKQVNITATKRNKYFNPKFSDNIKSSSNLNGPGNADEVILSEKILSSPAGSLSEALIGKMSSVRINRGMPYSNHGFQVKPMAVFVDGAQISANEMDNIPPQSIYSIEVLTSGAYLSMYGSNASHGALIITLKHGVDFSDNIPKSVTGLITYNIKGFYKEREFYSPKYIINDTTNVKDERKTIYWNPNIIINKSGETSINYFNASSSGLYRVVIEGIDEGGNLGREISHYMVE